MLKYRIILRINDIRYKIKLWLDIKLGYVAENGAPIKCPHCKHKDLEEYGHYYEEWGVVEYGVRCKHCGKKVGYFAYGTWDRWWMM